MKQDRTPKRSEEGLRHKVSDTRRTPQVLLAEDDDEMRRLLAQALRREGYQVVECLHGMDLLGCLYPFLHNTPSVSYDVIISDIRMPGITGLEILEGLHDHDAFPPMILITAFGDNATHAEAQRLGVAAMFDKPFEIADLMAKVHEVVTSHSPSGDTSS